MRKTILILAGVLFVGVAHANQPKSELSEKISSNFTVTYDLSSFCKAIVKGDVEAVKKLIELGEDVNQKSLGMAPVHFAARYNRAEILEILIANGANLKKRCDKGYTVKKHAELSQATDALRVIENAMKK